MCTPFEHTGMREIGREERMEAHSLQVLVDGPSKESGLSVPRHAAALNSLSLTGLVIPKIALGAGVAALTKQWEEYGVDKKWLESPYAKKIEKATRRKGLSDFERFKVMRLRKDVSDMEYRQPWSCCRSTSWLCAHK